MKRFQFPLQSLRTLREQKEQAAQQRYAEVLRAVEAAESQVQVTLAELESTWSWLRDQMTEGTFAERLDRTRAYCVVLDARRKLEEAALRREQERLEAAWQVMMLARRDREALDRFFEKRRRAHDREVQREDQKMLDDLGARLMTGSGAGRKLTAAELELA